MDIRAALPIGVPYAGLASQALSVAHAWVCRQPAYTSLPAAALPELLRGWPLPKASPAPLGAWW